MIPLPRLPAYYLRADNMPDEYTQTACRVQKRYSCWILHEALLLLGTRFFSHRKEIGMKEGMEKGLAEGMEKGMEKGRAEGKHEANTETAQRLLAMGLSAEQVAKATQLPLEIIKNLSNS